jgi:hypothetical protein
LQGRALALGAAESNGKVAMLKDVTGAGQLDMEVCRASAKAHALAAAQPVRAPLPPSASGSVAEVHNALVQTVADSDGDPRHAEQLVIVLDHLGIRAWRRAAMALVEYALSWGQWPPGEAGAAAYEADHGLPKPQSPCIELVDAAMLGYFRGGRDGARSVLVHADHDVLKGALRLLFVVAASCGAGMTEKKITRLMQTVCRDVL